MTARPPFTKADPRNTAPAVRLIVLMWMSLSCFSADAGVPVESNSRFRVEAPHRALVGVPVPEVRIVALTPDGAVDREFHGEVVITGVHVRMKSGKLTSTEFERGVLTLRTDLAAGRRVEVDSEITITPAEGSSIVRHRVHLVPGWMSLIPPLLAITLAVWWKEVVGALFLSALAGMMLLSPYPWMGIIETIDPLLLSMVTDRGHAEIILFTLLLGGMIGIMSGSGGSAALVARLSQRVRTRRHGQLATWFLGMVIFFDDYANSLLLGSTMRPILDRLRISREKLAFLIDSTAAPVAGLALISTWVGVEVGYIQVAYEGVGLGTENIYQTFVATLPYRFYPILLLGFVGIVGWTGRDFGAMLHAERQAFNTAEPKGQQKAEKAGDSPVRHAVIPLVVLCLCLIFALILDPDRSSRALLLAAAGAVVAAVLSVLAARKQSLGAVVGMAFEGMQQMLPAVVILLLAWSLATVCNGEHLNTAGFLVQLLEGRLSADWLPAITFLLAAAVSFATGTSYGTMGLLIPLCVAVQFQLLIESAVGVDQIGGHPLMLATVGAVLAGAIFGDHCSPISDTTILSSAASHCDHLAHVRTQMPYALTVAAVALFAGYLPTAFGVSPYLGIPGGLLVLWGGIRFFGQIPGERKG